MFQVNSTVVILCMTQDVHVFLSIDRVANAGEVNDVGAVLKFDLRFADLSHHRKLRLPLRILLLEYLIPDEDRIQVDKSVSVLENTFELRLNRSLLQILRPIEQVLLHA